MKKQSLEMLICIISGLAAGGCLILTQIGWAVFFLASPAMWILQKNLPQSGVWRFAAAFCYSFLSVAYFPAFFIRVNMGAVTEFFIDLAVYSVILFVHGSVLTAALSVALKLPMCLPLRPLSIAFFWTAAELLFGISAFAWPTARVSLSLWQYPIFINSARLGGQLFVSFLIILINALIGLSAVKIKSLISVISLALSVVLFCSNTALGYMAKEPVNEKISVALVQPGFTVIGEQQQILDHSFELTVKAAKDADAVILPESVLPSSFIKNEELFSKWKNVAVFYKTHLFVGGREQGHSAVFHFFPNGEYETYRKVREVPFFENGEGTRKFRLFPEDRIGKMTLNGTKIGTLICYESMFSSMTREMANEEIEMILVQTNDSWFDADSAKDLHLSHGVFRAVETGVPLVQAGMNGKTASVDKNGKVTDLLQDSSSGILYADVALTKGDTLYVKMGEGWLYIGIFLIFAASTATLLYRRKKGECPC